MLRSSERAGQHGQGQAEDDVDETGMNEESHGVASILIAAR